MTQQRVWLTSFVILHLFVRVAYQASPELNIPVPVVSLLETQPGQQTLVDGIECTDPDGDETRVFLLNTIPAYPCGKCFSVLPSASGAGYSLLYTRKQGRLLYSSSPSYLMQVACTDEVTTTTGIIEVRLLPNNAPTFDTPTQTYNTDELKATQNKRAGDVIYDDIEASEKGSTEECDAVFYSLTTTPSSGFFEIGYASGKIHAAQDLRLLCEDSVKHFVSTQDTYNTPVDNVVIDMALKAGNVKPVIANSETEVTLLEDVAVDTQVALLTVTDTTLYDNAKFKLRAVPERGLEYYKLEEQNGKWKIRTRTDLDYEYEYLRSVMLYVDVTDGFCDAETYSFRVTIENVNEVPEICPTKIKRCYYEGFIEEDLGWKVMDPDENEDLQWSTKNAKFYVDQDSGILYSDGEYDIDPNTEKEMQFLKIDVTDKEGETARGSVTLCIKDKNDNPPIFDANEYSVSASNCTKTGATLGQVQATDLDSEFEGNNQLVYSGTGGNFISVLAEGEVTLLRPCIPGERETIQGHVTDQGTFPGPLSGVPTTITFTCNVCPTPIPDTTTTTTTTTAAPAGDTDSLDLSLFWTILAGILALLLTSLLAYVLWRFCAPVCARRCSRPRPNRVPHRVQPKPVEKKPPPPAPERKKTPPANIPPPPEPPPDNDPFLFPFWKETFGDRDQRHMPQRDIVPFTVEQDQKVEEKEKVEEVNEKEQWKREREKVQENYRQEMDKYHEKVNSLRNPPPSPPPPPPKKKVCHIL